MAFERPERGEGRIRPLYGGFPLNLGFDVTAAKPKRVEDPETQPTQVRMRGDQKVLRNPSTDQKRVRRRMRKSAALSGECMYCGASVTYKAPVEGGFEGGYITDDGWGNLCMEAPDHRHMVAPLWGPGPDAMINPESSLTPDMVKPLGAVAARARQVLAGDDEDTFGGDDDTFWPGAYDDGFMDGATTAEQGKPKQTEFSSDAPKDYIKGYNDGYADRRAEYDEINTQGSRRKTGSRKQATKYRVVDNEFNQANAPDLIGKVFDSPPSYVAVELIDDPGEPTISLPPEFLEQYAEAAARKQAEMEVVRESLATRLRRALNSDPRVEAWKSVYQDDADGGLGAVRYLIGLTDGHALRLTPGEAADWVGIPVMARKQAGFTMKCTCGHSAIVHHGACTECSCSGYKQPAGTTGDYADVKGKTADVRHEPNPFGYQTDMRIGDQYQQGRDTKDIAADVRKEIKAMVSRGELPGPPIAYSVTIQRFSGGSSCDIKVKNWPRPERVETALNDGPPPGYHGPVGMAYGDKRIYVDTEAAEVLAKLNHLLDSHRRDASDIMTDYFDVNFYGTASMDWQTMPRQSARTAEVEKDDATQSGHAVSGLPDVEVGDEDDKPMWPWEIGNVEEAGRA